MKPVDFTYHRATGLDDALQRLNAGGDGVKLLGGGQSLGPMPNLRLARPRALIDVSSIAALRTRATDWRRPVGLGTVRGLRAGVGE